MKAIMLMRVWLALMSLATIASTWTLAGALR